MSLINKSKISNFFKHTTAAFIFYVSKNLQFRGNKLSRLIDEIILNKKLSEKTTPKPTRIKMLWSEQGSLICMVRKNFLRADFIPKKRTKHYDLLPYSRSELLQFRRKHTEQREHQQVSLQVSLMLFGNTVNEWEKKLRWL